MRTSKIFVTVDVVLWRASVSGGHIVLIQRKNPPFENQWALPGGFVDENEDLPDAARRELLEETGIRVNHIEQLKAFGKPRRDPRGHMVSVAFLARMSDENVQPQAADDAADAKWFLVNDLPKLAFDHAEIISFALTKT